MSGGIYEVKHIFVAVSALVGKSGSLKLDGYSPLSLQIHIIEKLLFHISVLHEACLFYYPVGQSGFAVIYMGSYAEISYILLIIFVRHLFLT